MIKLKCSHKLCALLGLEVKFWLRHVNVILLYCFGITQNVCHGQYLERKIPMFTFDKDHLGDNDVEM